MAPEVCREGGGGLGVEGGPEGCGIRVGGVDGARHGRLLVGRLRRLGSSKLGDPGEQLDISLARVAVGGELGHVAREAEQ